MKKTALIMLLQARWSICCILALSLLSAGCANQAGMTAAAGAASASPLRAYSESIDIGGRFSSQFQRNGKPEAWSGSFTWAQSPEGITVKLQSPFGQTLATITANEGVATLTQSGQPPRSAANVDALAQQALGWPLPISDLRDWLQAYAVTADGKRIMATPQSTAPIATRDGWLIHFVAWQENVPSMPKRIDMERDTAAAEAGKVTMRLVITDWQTR